MVIHSHVGCIILAATNGGQQKQYVVISFFQADFNRDYGLLMQNAQ